MQRNLSRSLGLAIGLLLLVGITGCSSGPSNWTFTDAEGDLRTMSDYTGGVVVLAFTNSWCDSCHHAALHLQDLQQRFADQGVRVVYVSSWEHGDPVAYLEEHGYTYGLMLNGTRIAQEYKVDVIPTFCVLGSNGQLVGKIEGFNRGTPARLSGTIQRHLRKKDMRTASHNAG